MKKAVLLLFIFALIISSAGCAGKNGKEIGVQKVPDTQELRSNETQDANTPQTGVEGNPHAEWKYIDPSLVAVLGEEDEKLTNV